MRHRTYSHGAASASPPAGMGKGRSDREKYIRPLPAVVSPPDVSVFETPQSRERDSRGISSGQIAIDEAERSFALKLAGPHPEKCDSRCRLSKHLCCSQENGSTTPTGRRGGPRWKMFPGAGLQEKTGCFARSSCFRSSFFSVPVTSDRMPAGHWASFSSCWPAPSSESPMCSSWG